MLPTFPGLLNPPHQGFPERRDGFESSQSWVLLRALIFPEVLGPNAFSFLFFFPLNSGKINCISLVRVCQLFRRKVAERQ